MTEPAKPLSSTIRGNILAIALELIEGARTEAYGDPMLNLDCASVLKNTVRAFKQRQMSAVEQEAIDQCLTKIARIYTGPRYLPDNYIDLAGYAAIAGEAAARFQPAAGPVSESPEASTMAADAE